VELSIKPKLLKLTLPGYRTATAVAGEPATKDSQMSVDLVVGGNENVSNTEVVETTQMQSLTASARYSDYVHS